mgnify:CR=1 FL=1
MRYCFIFIAFVSLLCSCKGTQPVDDADVLVKSEGPDFETFGDKTADPARIVLG